MKILKILSLFFLLTPSAFADRNLPSSDRYGGGSGHGDGSGYNYCYGDGSGYGDGYGHGSSS